LGFEGRGAAAESCNTGTWFVAKVDLSWATFASCCDDDDDDDGLRGTKSATFPGNPFGYSSLAQTNCPVISASSIFFPLFKTPPQHEGKPSLGLNT
jgi:hypothetical protein